MTLKNKYFIILSKAHSRMNSLREQTIELVLQFSYKQGGKSEQNARKTAKRKGGGEQGEMNKNVLEDCLN